MKVSKIENNNIPGSQHLVQSLIDLAETGIYIVAQGKFVYVSYLFEKLSGYTIEELLGQQSLTLVHQDDREKVREAAIAMLKGELQSPYEYRFLNKDGSISWVLGKIISIDYDHGKAALGSFWDITHHKLIEEQFAQQRLFLRQVIDSNPSLIFVKDCDDRYILVNKALANAYGASPNTMEGKTDIQLGGAPEEYEKYRLDDLDVLQSGKTKIIPEESFTWPSGKLHYYQTVKLPLVNEKAETSGILGVSTDITERKNLERELSDLATHDALTGLPNRKLLNDRFHIAAALANREQKKIAIAMIDLDGFKAINDTYGHDTGDKLLKEVSTRLLSNLRKSDTVARIGGDEFALHLTGITDRKAVCDAADRILGSFRVPLITNGHSINCTLSMGITLYPDDGNDIDTLLIKADTLMYSAKETGKNIYKYSWG